MHANEFELKQTLEMMMVHQFTIFHKYIDLYIVFCMFAKSSNNQLQLFVVFIMELIEIYTHTQ